MEKGMLFGFLVSLCMSFGAFAIFLWAVFSGQMDETEDVKYRILEREEEGGEGS